MLAKGGEHAWYPMSSDDRAQRNESPWKRTPTAIAIPKTLPKSSNEPNQTNLPSHSSHISSTAMSRPDPLNPYSGRMANTLRPRTRQQNKAPVGNRTANSTITTAPPRKKKRTEGRLKPPLGPEEPEATEIDPVEVSSGDEINGFEPSTHRTKKRDRPQLAVQNGDAVHAFDVDLDSPPSNAVASTLRIHEDGPSTLSLQQRLEMSLSAGSTSSIEQFDDEQKPSTNRVTELRKKFEFRDKLHEGRGKPAPPHINLRGVPLVKSNMKAKKPVDPVATASTHFQRGRRSAAPKQSAYELPIKACYFDSRFIPDGSETGPMRLAWNPGGSNWSISYESSRGKVQYDLNVADAQYVDYTQQQPASDAHDGMPVVNIVMYQGSRIDAVRNPDPNSVPVKFPVQAITIKLDTCGSWPNGVYDQFIRWIGHRVPTSLSRNPKQIWEMAERALPQDSGSEVVSPEVEEPVSRLSVGPRTSDTRSQTDVPQERSDIQSTDDPTSAPRRSKRILTVKKPIIAVDPDEVILVYPQGVPGAINITNADVSRLQPGEFLNDTLIEFGLKLWHTELGTSNPELAKQIHVFSSFFYKKLNKRNLEEGYESVRKWTSKINLFDKKYIIIPINEHLHWYLAIIFMPEHTLLPPPPTLVKQTAASRTRSRTSLAAKEAAEIEVPIDCSSPLTPTSDAEEKNELTKHMDEFSCKVSVTEVNTPNGMDISPDNSASLDAPRPVDEFAMDIDKSEEMAVQEQLRLHSPTASELGTGHAQSSGDRPATAYMDVETEQADKPVETISSRYFAKEPEANVIELNSQGQHVATTSSTEVNPSEQIQEEDLNQQEEEDIQESGDINLSQRTYIFTLDSLGARHVHAIRQLTRYLKMEAQDKQNIASNNTSNAIGKALPVPPQPNFCDCGVYLLHFAQTFMADPAKYFKIINENKKTPPISERKEIWEDHKVGTMREELEERIKDLSREWKQARAAKDVAKKDQTDTVQESDSSDIEYVDLAPASTVQGKGKTSKGGTTKKTKTARLRG